jgi:hypothetical protein
VANANLKPFTSENQPTNRKSRKGIPNRSTVYKRLLKMKAGEVLPDAQDIEKEMTLIEAAALGQIVSARNGNTNAWKEIQDSLHGKIADKTELTGDGGKDLFPQKFIVEIVQNDGDGGSDKN